MHHQFYPSARPLPQLRNPFRGVLFRTPITALAVTLLLPLVVLLDVF